MLNYRTVKLGLGVLGFTFLFSIFMGCQDQPSTNAKDGQPGSAMGNPADSGPEGEGSASTRESEILALKPELPVKITASFTRASHTGKAGTMSVLDFNFVAKQDEEQVAGRRLELQSAAKDNELQFDFPECGVKFSVMMDALTDLGQHYYGSYGGYRIELASPEHLSLAVFEIDKAGQLTRTEGRNGHKLHMLLAAPAEQLYSYSVFAPEAARDDPLLAVEIKVLDFETQTAAGGSGDEYEYRVPGLEVTIHSQELAKELELSRGANQEGISHDPAGGFWVPM
jgi:hypothetical protein